MNGHNPQDNQVPQMGDLDSNDQRVTYDLTDDVQKALAQVNNQQMLPTTKGKIGADELTVKVEIHGASTPLLLTITEDGAVLGRRDPSSQVIPELDLAPYGGYQMGISRRHAILRLNNKYLEVIDLGSRNGSYLNGSRLVAHREKRVSDGSELRLGKIVMLLNFQV